MQSLDCMGRPSYGSGHVLSCSPRSTLCTYNSSGALFIEHQEYIVFCFGNIGASGQAMQGEKNYCYKIVDNWVS
jgi:hypothetical protein